MTDESEKTDNKPVGSVDFLAQKLTEN